VALAVAAQEVEGPQLVARQAEARVDPMLVALDPEDKPLHLVPLVPQANEDPRHQGMDSQAVIRRQAATCQAVVREVGSQVPTIRSVAMQRVATEAPIGASPVRAGE